MISKANSKYSLSGARYQRRKAIRLLCKPSTAGCDLDQYTYFRMSEPKYAGCCGLSEVIGVSRHSVNGFLLREQYEK